jgi:hypothetical protein
LIVPSGCDMDVLPRMTRPLFELFRAMSPIQRATFVAVPALVLAGLTWLVVFNRPDDHQPVLFGRTFASDELFIAEKALNQAGLLNYRRDDRRLLAPAAELDRYNAALVEFDAVPPDLGSQMLKQFETLGPFSTDRHRQEMKDALLLQELRRMIKAVPDIEDARVAVASSGRRVGFGQKPRVTANVTVKPRAGREVSARLVGSLRQAVASMVPDLLPADVTVFDVAKGQAYSGEQNDDPLDGRLLQRVREFTRQYEQQIQKALAFIPNATVAVHVDIDNLKSSVVRQERIRTNHADPPSGDGNGKGNGGVNEPGGVQLIGHDDTEPGAIRYSAGFRGPDSPSTDFTREFSERELLAAMPRAVQVSVGIPREYYRDVAARRKAQTETHNRRLDLDSIEEEVLTKVERTVGRLIPVGSPHDAISVTTVDRMTDEPVEPTLTAVDQLSVLAWRHGGSIALGLLVIWALWMLSRLSAAAPAQRSPTPFTTPPTQHAAPPQHPIETPSPTTVPPPFASEPTHPMAAPPRGQVGPETLEVSAAGIASERREQSLHNDSPIELSTRMSPAGTVGATDASDSMFSGSNGHRGASHSVESHGIESRSNEYGPFEFLIGRHPDDVRQLLQDERPQTIAVIAAQLAPAMSAAVLAGLAPDLQADILQRVARLGPTDPGILADIAAELKNRLGRTRVRAGGVSNAAAVLRESSRPAARSILATMDEDLDSDLADELRQTLFSFDDLLKLDDDTLRVILEETDDRQWALALKASPEPVRQKVLGCLPTRVVQAFKDEMDSLGPVRLSEVTSVRQQIADSIHRLDEAGLIVLPVN